MINILIVLFWPLNHLQLSDFQSDQYLFTAIGNWQRTHRILHYFTAIEVILVWLQISKREVEALLKLHNLRIDYVMIQSELKNWIAAQYRGSVKLNGQPVPTRSKSQGVISGPGYPKVQGTQSCPLVISNLDWSLWFGSNTDHSQVTQNCC